MPILSPVSALSDHELLERLHTLVRRSNEVTADLIEHLAEVDRRKLHLVRASSLHDYCTRRLGLSDAAAYKRIAVARVAQCFPEVIERLRAGRLHLSGAVTVGPHLRQDNYAELLSLAEGKSQRDLERLLAARFPKPDVAESIRKLRAKGASRQESGVLNAPVPVAGRALGSEQPSGAFEAPALESLPSPAGRTEGSSPSGLTSRTASPPERERPDTRPSVNAHSSDTGRLEPLSAKSYSVKFTASERLHAKIREAQALVSHTLPKGELAGLFELALDLLIGEQKKRRFGIQPSRSSNAQSRAPSKKTTAQVQRKPSRYVPVAVRREVAERDEVRCAYVDPEGERCSERRFLEFEHVVPHARGGKSDSETLRLFCRGHNQLMALREFGSGHIQRAIETRRAKTRANVTTSPPQANSS